MYSPTGTPLSKSSTTWTSRKTSSVVFTATGRLILFFSSILCTLPVLNVPRPFSNVPSCPSWRPTTSSPRLNLVPERPPLSPSRSFRESTRPSPSARLSSWPPPVNWPCKSKRLCWPSANSWTSNATPVSVVLPFVKTSTSCKPVSTSLSVPPVVSTIWSPTAKPSTPLSLRCSFLMKPMKCCLVVSRNKSTKFSSSCRLISKSSCWALPCPPMCWKLQPSSCASPFEFWSSAMNWPSKVCFFILLLPASHSLRYQAVLRRRWKGRMEVWHTLWFIRNHYHFPSCHFLQCQENSRLCHWKALGQQLHGLCPPRWYGAS